MKDGKLFEVDGRYELRFVRPLPHPVGKVWDAITTPSGLAAWFPFDVVGPRETGAALRFEFREGEGPSFTGSMVEFDAPRVMERGTSGSGSSSPRRTTLINRFDEIGKAARDAAGWHACLDGLEASLTGAAFDGTARWQAVHPGYVERLGPAASSIGPPS